MRKNKTEIEWIDVQDALPKIPEGKYGVPVLVVTFDAVYEEAHPGEGMDVYAISYGRVTDRKGKRLKWFENCDGEYSFMTLFSGPSGSDWGPPCDKILYWAYMPNPPVRKKPDKSFAEKYGLGEGVPYKTSEATRDYIRELYERGERAVKAGEYYAKHCKTRFGG